MPSAKTATGLKERKTTEQGLAGSKFGAGEGIRTLNIQLGKLTLYH